VTIFTDASALIAMIAGEADSDTLANRLDEEQRPLCSPMSLADGMQMPVPCPGEVLE
jgi:uncharacterized protein with PIN domain